MTTLLNAGNVHAKYGSKTVMLTSVTLLLVLGPNAWMLSPRDLAVKVDPNSFGGAKTTARSRIEEQYFATNYYDRKDLAKRMQWYTTGFENRVWRSLEVGWYDAALPEEKQKAPLGSLEATDDFEELMIRVLFDYRRTHPTAYIPLLKRLLALDPKNYRLLRARYSSCFYVGTDGPAASTFYAERARDIRPNDPATTMLMFGYYFNRVAYRLGDIEQDFRMFRSWEKAAQQIVKSSSDPAALNDQMWLKSSAETAQRIVFNFRKQGG